MTYLATATQIGTNERITAEGDTPEAAIAKLMGRPYGPVPGTIATYKLPEEGTK